MADDTRSPPSDDPPGGAWGNAADEQAARVDAAREIVRAVKAATANVAVSLATSGQRRIVAAGQLRPLTPGGVDATIDTLIGDIVEQTDMVASLLEIRKWL